MCERNPYYIEAEDLFLYCRNDDEFSLSIAHLDVKQCSFILQALNAFDEEHSGRMGCLGLIDLRKEGER